MSGGRARENSLDRQPGQGQEDLSGAISALSGETEEERAQRLLSRLASAKELKRMLREEAEAKRRATGRLWEAADAARSSPQPTKAELEAEAAKGKKAAEGLVPLPVFDRRKSLLNLGKAEETLEAALAALGHATAMSTLKAYEAEKLAKSEVERLASLRLGKKGKEKRSESKDARKSRRSPSPARGRRSRSTSRRCKGSKGRRGKSRSKSGKSNSGSGSRDSRRSPS